MLKNLTHYVAGAALILASALAQAGVVPYEASLLSQLQAKGKSVVVDFHAPWCPTCKKQETIINDLAAQPRFKELTILRADFDSEKSLKKAMHGRSQSTLVVFKGSKEITRSTGDTQPAKIEALFNQAL